MRINGWWKAYSARPGEPHLIDQLRVQQFVEHRVDLQSGEQVASKYAPITDAAVNVRLAWALSRSMRGLDGRLHRGRHADLGDVLEQT